jgi:hypothetical protein
MLIRLREPLREADKKEGSDGGGGDDNAPKYLTEEQFGEVFNKAFTAKWRSLEKQLQGSQEKLQEGLLSKLDERFAQLSPPPPKDPPPEKGKESEFEKQLKTLADQLESEKAARQASDNARIEIENARRFDTGRISLREGLKEKAHPAYLDDWVDRLTVVEKRLKVDDDGNALLRVTHAPYRGSPEVEEELPLTQAIPILIAREESKRWQAPPPAGDGRAGGKGPSGSGVPGSRSPKSDSSNPIERADARMRELYGVSLEAALSKEPS